MKPDQIWKEVPGFPGYEVSEYGQLRRNGSPIKFHRQQGSGRKRYRLYKDGKEYTKHAAHLVAIAFLGKKPFGKVEVCHNDGFEHNNHYSNLRWGTRINNCNDTTKHRIQRLLQSGLPLTKRQQDKLATAQFLASVQR